MSEEPKTKERTKKLSSRTKSVGSGSSSKIKSDDKDSETRRKRLTHGDRSKSTDTRDKSSATHKNDITLKDLKKSDSSSRELAKKLKEEQSAFSKEKKEWENERKKFLESYNSEMDQLKEKLLILEHKEEDQSYRIDNLISELNLIKKKKNDREEVLFKQIEELRISLTQYENIEKEELENVNSLWSKPIITDIQTGVEIDIRGQWKGKTAGGSFNNITWRHNPNIFLSVKQNSTITFSLFQPISDVMHHMSFYVIKTYSPFGRRQIKSVPEQDIVCEGYYSSLKPNKVTVVAELPASPNPYIILPACFYPGNESQFVVKIKSSTCVSAKLISEQDEWPVYEGKWEGHVAGGCTNFPSFVDNPQYIFKVNQKSNLQFHLFQTEKSRDSFDTIGLYCIKAEPGQVQKISIFKQQDSIKFLDFKSPNEALLEVSLDVGEYIIIPSTFNPKHESSYQLRVFFSEEKAPITPLKLLRDINWISVKGSWKQGNAGGSINEPSEWVKNVQYLFTLPKDLKINFVLDQIQEPNKKLFGIGFSIYKSDKRVTNSNEKPIFAPDFRPNKRLSEFTTLSKGTYVIVPTTFEANQHCSYELKFNSPELLVNEPVNMSVI